MRRNFSSLVTRMLFFLLFMSVTSHNGVAANLTADRVHGEKEHKRNQGSHDACSNGEGIVALGNAQAIGPKVEHQKLVGDHGIIENKVVVKAA